LCTLGLWWHEVWGIYMRISLFGLSSRVLVSWSCRLGVYNWFCPHLHLSGFNLDFVFWILIRILSFIIYYYYGYYYGTVLTTCSIYCLSLTVSFQYMLDSYYLLCLSYYINLLTCLLAFYILILYSPFILFTACLHDWIAKLWSCTRVLVCTHHLPSFYVLTGLFSDNPEPVCPDPEAQRKRGGNFGFLRGASDQP